MIFKTNIRQIIAICAACLWQTTLAGAQTHFTPVRTAYSALSAGIGTLWLTHEQAYFKKHGLESNLIYIRGGTTAVQALLAGEIQFGHLSPAPMMTAWAQGADYPGLKGMEAARDSLLDSTPQLKQVDLRKFIDDRFVKAK